MVKNVIFDIGNVLVDFEWKTLFKNAGMDDETIKRVAKATVGDPDWNEIDRGALTDDEIIDLFVDNDPEMEPWIRKAFSNIHDMLVQRAYTKGWIIDLKKRGYNVYCLSNMSSKAVTDCPDAIDFLNLTDGYLLSCTVKYTKPEREIYEIFLDRFKLDPAECVFIDDVKANIDAAAEFGIKGIIFKDVKSASEELDTVLAEGYEKPVVKHGKPARVTAIIAVVLLVGIYITTLVASIIDTGYSDTLFKVSLAATIGVPVVSWVIIRVTERMLQKK